VVRQIDEIIVHCSATRPEWMDGHSVEAKRDEIRRWHIEDRGWRDIGYAMIIDRDGSVADGRDLDGDGDTFDDIGAHAKGRNSRSVGVCLLGGFGSSATDEFADNFTPEQDAALRRVIARVKNYIGRDIPVKGHNDYANKACPGFNAARWYAHKPSVRGSIAESNTMQASAVGAVTAAGSGVAAVGQLEGQAQTLTIIIAGVILLAFLFIMRERIKKWAKGDR